MLLFQFVATYAMMTCTYLSTGKTFEPIPSRIMITVMTAKDVTRPCWCEIPIAFNVTALYFF